MITQLLDLDINQSTLEDILNKKKEFWDKGNWSEIFWKLIKQEGLKINKDKSYTLDSQNKKNIQYQRIHKYTTGERSDRETADAAC